MCPRGQKGFLRHVIRVGIVAEKLPQKCPHRLLVSIDEQIEGALRTVPSRIDERGVIIAHRWGV
jgi:hypothetical protein